MRGAWYICMFTCVFDVYVKELALMCDVWSTGMFTCVLDAYVNVGYSP